MTVPEGGLSERRKAGLVAEVTEQILAAAGLTETDALRVWVLTHEQPEGTWGAAGHIVKFQELAALAQGQRENA
ncbi:tautomerase family protein [Nocardia gamkensis]|uniref:tautomerase family protein n=1 Tax=Nocardia gamkensis TaxID=352869 RepID=UPI0036F0F436